MFRQARLAFALTACTAACSAAPGAPPSAPRAEGQTDAPIFTGKARFFQVSADDTFWVTHDANRDRVVSTGARLELSPAGEVLAAAVETEKANEGDVLLGGFAVSEAHGGTYLFWSQSRLFRASAFTGPLTPVPLGTSDAAETAIRGIRHGLRAPVLMTDSGLRELLPGAKAATPFPDAGVTDIAAIDSQRAIRMDVFGRTAWTTDGGKTWNEAMHITGAGVRAIGASLEEVWFETNQGRSILRKEGPLGEPEGQSYRYVDYARPFQLSFRGTRADRDDQYLWGYRDAQPLQAAVLSGVQISENEALGVMRGTVSRVDLKTGRVISVATDWLPSGIECQPLRLGEDVLFACSWDDQSGSYVLRMNGNSPPVMERLFTDEGMYVADDAGGFGYTGSCKPEQKYVDPERYYSGRYGRYYDGDEGEYGRVEPVLCVRRGADDWVERRISLDADSSLFAWIPQKDGNAVALVRGQGRGAMLPDVTRGSQREQEQNAVRVVRVFPSIQGWTWPQQQARAYYGRGGSAPLLIDRRYRVLDDGTIVGWLGGANEDRYQPTQKWAGGMLHTDGRTELFELPKEPRAMAVTGPWGVLTTNDGAMFETQDRGRTWRAAGSASLLPGTLTGGCSSLGCSFSTGVKLGWGAASPAPTISGEKREEFSSGARLPAKIVCEASGVPKAEPSTLSPAAAALGSQAKIVIQTNFGASLELIRETPDAISAASPYPYYRHRPPPPPPVPTATATASASAKPAAKPVAKAAPTRTHTLVFRPPLDPLAPIVRHNATNAAVGGYRSRGVATPLLGLNGDVSLMYFADQNEAIADRNDLITMPQFDTRRYYYYDQSMAFPGLRIANNRALIFGDFRRRASLEEHGHAPAKPPFYFSFDREGNRRRALAMGVRDDGATGVLVLDAAAPETVGLASFDRSTSVLSQVRKLAPWSAMKTADAAVCQQDKKAYRALLTIDPTVWFKLDDASLPGVSLSKQGLMLVRWSEENVCLEALDVAVMDPRRRPDGPAGESLVIRWTAPVRSKTPAKEAVSSNMNAALRSLELMQPLTCSVSQSSN